MADSVPDTSAEDLRAAMLDQLRYLADEAEAVEAFVDQIPEPIRAGRPTPDDLSIKEMYGVIAWVDERVHQPRVKAIAAGAAGETASTSVDEETVAADANWNDRALTDILARVQVARRELADRLEALDPDAWQQAVEVAGETRDVYAWVHHIIQGDIQRLRRVSRRLYESNLSGGPQ